MVGVTERETRIGLDSPAGLVEAALTVSAGCAERVALRNLPAFVEQIDTQVDVETLGPPSATASHTAATSMRSSRLPRSIWSRCRRTPTS